MVNKRKSEPDYRHDIIDERLKEKPVEVAARESGLAKQTVQRARRGENISVATLRKLGRTLSIPKEQLL